MITLVLYLCLVNNPSDCIKHTEPWDYGWQACTLYNQQRAVEVLKQYPKRKFVKAKCVFEPTNGAHI